MTRTKKFSLILVSVIAVICLFNFSSKAATITLINENFATGTGRTDTGTTTWSHNGLSWIWSLVGSSGVAPTGSEVYNAFYSPARGMPTSHGGFELFSISASEPASGTIWQVAVQVTLPTNYPNVWSGNTISFDMGYRNFISNSSFELYNITDDRSIFSQTITGGIGFWDSRTFNPTFSAADAGDIVELRWRDAAAASLQTASGLQVGAVVFNVVPEPSALSLLAVGLGVVLRRRRRTV